MSNLICRKTMLQCPTPSMCSPYGGCIDPLAAQLKSVVINQEVRRFVGQDDQRKIDELVAEGIEVDKREIARLKAENERLRQIIINSAKEVGAALSTECSLEFMERLPQEIWLVMQRQQDEADQLTTELAKLRTLSGGKR